LLGETHHRAKWQLLQLDIQAALREVRGVTHRGANWQLLQLDIQAALREVRL
jgi:hypothetical protein